MEFRLMRAGEVEEVVGVWRAANVARGKPPTPARVARVGAKLGERGSTTYVAADGEAIVGMVLSEPRRENDGAGPVMPNEVHVSMVFTSPPAQRRGVGRGLLNHVCGCARDAGATSVSLWTGRENLAARKLYEACGMRIERVRPVGPDREWVLYELKL